MCHSPSVGGKPSGPLSIPHAGPQERGSLQPATSPLPSPLPALRGFRGSQTQLLDTSLLSVLPAVGERGTKQATGGPAEQEPVGFLGAFPVPPAYPSLLALLEKDKDCHVPGAQCWT